MSWGEGVLGCPLGKECGSCPDTFQRVAAVIRALYSFSRDNSNHSVR